MVIYRFRGEFIALSALLVGCCCLEIPQNVHKHDAEGASKCGAEQCKADVGGESGTAPTPDVEAPSEKAKSWDEASKRTPMLPVPRQPTKEEMKAIHKNIERDFRQDEHPDEPKKETLERWGFYDKPTFGELEMKRDTDYSAGIGHFESLIADDKKLTKQQKHDINADLEKFLEDDHNFQVWSAFLYKQERAKRKKRGIEESKIYSYEEMPNPYYQKNK